MTNIRLSKSNHPEYPERLNMSNHIMPNKRLVEIVRKSLLDIYHEKCPYYESETLKKYAGIWADFEDISEEELKKRMIWLNGNLTPLSQTDIIFTDGKPITPVYTGLKGRGLLGKYGPNHAADPIVTRLNPTTYDLEFVAALRLDTNPQQWCIPGGMVDPGESVSVTLKREFTEEVASQNDSDILDEIFSKGDVLYSGPTFDDPRTTDHAWIETYVVHYHLSYNLAKKIKLTPQEGENSAVQWISCNTPNLYGDHKHFINLAKKNMKYKDYKIIFLTIVLPTIMGIGVIYIQSYIISSRYFKSYPVPYSPSDWYSIN